MLLGRFGHPNGPMTMSIPNGDPDAPFKWDFIFNLPGVGTIDICRSWKHLSICSRRVKVNPKHLLNFINFNLNKHISIIDKVRSSLEDYRILINPYKRHEVLAKDSFEEIINHKTIKVFYPTSIHATEKQIKRHNISFNKYLTSMNKESSLSISLCTQSAFMVESYLNLLLALLIKADIKNDKDKFQNTINRTWRNKIKNLHLDCHYISKIDYGNSIIREVGILFDLRNKIAHSYPHKEDLTVSNMWFFKNFPIMKNPIPFDTFQISENNKLPSKNQALESYKTAKEMILYIDSFLDEEIKEQFKILANSNPIGFNDKKNIYSVPFGALVNKVFLPI